MSNYAPINEEYVVGQDSSVAFESEIIPLRLPYASIIYQVNWAEGVSGLMVWEGTIYDPSLDRWERLVGCDEVTLEMGISGGHGIVALTDAWMTVGFLRMRWLPITDESSTGAIDVAIRIVPI